MLHTYPCIIGFLQIRFIYHIAYQKQSYFNNYLPNYRHYDPAINNADPVERYRDSCTDKTRLGSFLNCF